MCMYMSVTREECFAELSRNYRLRFSRETETESGNPLPTCQGPKEEMHEDTLSAVEERFATGDTPVR